MEFKYDKAQTGKRTTWCWSLKGRAVVFTFTFTTTQTIRTTYTAASNCTVLFLCMKDKSRYQIAGCWVVIATATAVLYTATNVLFRASSVPAKANSKNCSSRNFTTGTWTGSRKTIMKPRTVRSITRRVLIELSVAILIAVGIPVGCLFVDNFTINKPSLPAK